MNLCKMVGLLGLSITSFGLTACSNNAQFLKSMNLSVSERDRSSYVNLSVELDLGNVALESLQIPVYDPHTQVEIGQINLNHLETGKEQIMLSVNANSVLHGDSSLGQTLPNGRMLPSSAGAVAGDIFGIPVMNYSRIYIGGDLKNSITVGIALAIPALDRVTGRAGISANIFFAQIFNADLSGVAGIYASGNEHQNGIAVFGKYTAPASASLPIVQSVRKISAISSIKVSGVTSIKSANTVVDEGMGEKGATRLYQYFYGKKRKIHPD